MVGFEKVTMWPLIAAMFLIGIYPTPLVKYFNQSARELLAFVQNLI